LVYYWIVITGKKINLKEFAQSVELSELTINKIVKEIGEILEIQREAAK
jgi:DNA-binding Xre family transcriptional regulator